jgi:cytosine permease
VKAIGAWVIGVLSAKFLPGIPPINGVLIAAGSFIVISKFIKVEQKQVEELVG